MDKKGRRFASDNSGDTKIVRLHATDEQTEQNNQDKQDKSQEKDARLKKKNAKRLDKLMKKQKRREKTADSDAKSTEVKALEEREDKHPSIRRSNKKRIILAVIIAVLLFVIVFFVVNVDRFSFNNISNFIRYGIFGQNSEESFPIDVQGESVSAGNFMRVGQDLTYASDTKLRTVNNYGKTSDTVQHGFSSPVLVASPHYSLVYNLGADGFLIKESGEEAYIAAAEDNIHVADIVDNGTYALVTQSDGYLSKLLVYDKDHTRIFAYSFADYYITSVSLSASGRQAVLSGVSALNGAGISAVYVLDFTKDTPVYLKEFEDNIIYEAAYLNDSHACAIGSTMSCVINTRNGQVESASYGGKALTAYDINTDTDTFTLALSRSGDGRNCDICSYNASGVLANSFQFEDKPVAISSYKNRVAILTGEKVCLYLKDGYSVAEKDAVVDSRAIALYTTGDAYILSTSEINSISF